MTGEFNRRKFLQSSAAVGAAGAAPALMSSSVFAQSKGTLNFHGWSAAVDQVKSHISAFEAKTGVKVAYSTSPWAQYREGMITKLVGKAPIDVMWVSDTWLPEWAAAGWLAPIDKYAQLTQYNNTKEIDDFCVSSVTYAGKQYGLTYYSDYMAFIYDEEKLKRAGFSAPPKTWDEVVEQSIKIKQQGIAEFPLMMCMAQESWQIEYLSSLVYSFGGRYVNDNGTAAMGDPKGGAVRAMQWLVDAVHKHKVVSPGCVELGELNGLKAFTSGNHVFALMPNYRMRTINDPKQSQVAGKIRPALMPTGGGHNQSNTVGWMRFYGMTPQAVANPERLDASLKFMEWFGGKADGDYKFQKLVFLDIGAGFGVKSLYADPAIKAAYQRYHDPSVVQQQNALARKKDIISPWFGEWNEVHAPGWQAAVLNKATPQSVLTRSADLWNKLRRKA
ncbi:MAG: extracellular solute-binding protein [Burkholderiales bacterium]